MVNLFQYRHQKAKKTAIASKRTVTLAEVVMIVKQKEKLDSQGQLALNIAVRVIDPTPNVL